MPDAPGPPENRLDALLDAWQAARDRGTEIAPADLCRGCPELLSGVEHRVAALRRWDALGTPDDPVTAPADSPGTITGSDLPATRSTSPRAPTREAPASDPPGYEVLGELGRGGMGVVYSNRSQG